MVENAKNNMQKTNGYSNQLKGYWCSHSITMLTEVLTAYPRYALFYVLPFEAPRLPPDKRGRSVNYSDTID